MFIIRVSVKWSRENGRAESLDKWKKKKKVKEGRGRKEGGRSVSGRASSNIRSEEEDRKCFLVGMAKSSEGNICSSGRQERRRNHERALKVGNPLGNQ